MSRDEEHEAAMRRAMHTMAKKRKPILSRANYRKGMAVIASGKFGYWVGYDETNNGKPWYEPILVQFDGMKAEWFSVGEVRPATFGEYCLNPNGFGRTSWMAFILSMGLVGWGIATAVSEGGWAWACFLMPPAGIMLGTWMNFKGKWQ